MALARLNCRALHRKCRVPQAILEHHVHPLTGLGILSALKAALHGTARNGSFRDVFDSKGVLPEERRALRKFLLAQDWFHDLKKNDHRACTELLRRLPIFERAAAFRPGVEQDGCCETEPCTLEFTDLLECCYIAPEGEDTKWV